MKTTTLLMTVTTVVLSGVAAQAQVYVQPANYYYYPNNAYAANAYPASQPVYTPASQPVYAPASQPAYASASQPVYAPAAYTPVTTYYAGSACGQAVPCSYNCASPCACDPSGGNYAAASPYVPQAVYAPVTYAPAPVACGPQIRRGSLGQPTVYVPGQPIRNFFRYFAL